MRLAQTPDPASGRGEFCNPTDSPSYLVSDHNLLSSVVQLFAD